MIKRVHTLNKESSNMVTRVFSIYHLQEYMLLAFSTYQKICGFPTQMGSHCRTVCKEPLTGAVKRFTSVSGKEALIFTVLVSCKESQSFHSLMQLGVSWYVPLQGVCFRKHCQLCCPFLKNDDEGLQTDITKGVFFKKICGFYFTGL